jgi:hypothetical protein
MTLILFDKLNALNSSQSGNGMKCRQFDKCLNYFIEQPKYHVMDRFTSKTRQIAAGFIDVTSLEDLNILNACLGFYLTNGSMIVIFLIMFPNVLNIHFFVAILVIVGHQLLLELTLQKLRKIILLKQLFHLKSQFNFNVINHILNI